MSQPGLKIPRHGVYIYIRPWEFSFFYAIDSNNNEFQSNLMLHSFTCFPFFLIFFALLFLILIFFFLFIFFSLFRRLLQTICIIRDELSLEDRFLR